MLPLDKFRDIIRHGILLAIDLVVRNDKGEVLLGLRKNAPAQGFWFVPGGRVHKNEKLRDALRRISNEEVGIEIAAEDIRVIGIYDHIYHDNFLGEAGYNTHYIVIACEAIIEKGITDIPALQHEAFKFMKVSDLLVAEDVHEYTKNYFMDSPDNLFVRS